MRQRRHAYKKTAGWLRAELAHHGIPHAITKPDHLGNPRRTCLTEAQMEAELAKLGYTFGAEDRNDASANR